MPKTMHLLGLYASGQPENFHATTDENLVVWTIQEFKDGTLQEAGKIDGKDVAVLSWGWKTNLSTGGLQRAVVATVYYSGSAITKKFDLASDTEVSATEWREWDVAKAYAERTVRECAAFL